MKYYLRYITLLALFFDGCSKTSTSQKEDFSFYGTLTDCVSGKPFSGTHITVMGGTPGSTGLFGATARSYNLGAAYTDNNGSFKITPLKQSGIISYYFLLDSPLQYITTCPSITADSIQRTALAEYNMSFSPNTYHYLKVIFTDSNMPDPSDTLILDVNCNGNGCGPGFNTFEVASSPSAIYYQSDRFAGNIRNGYAVFPIVGNSTNLVAYLKVSRFFTDSQHGAYVNCGMNDTAYCNINY